MGELGFFSVHQWLLIQDLHIIFSPFDDVRSHNKVRINDMLNLVFLLEHTLHGSIDWAPKAHQSREHEGLLLT